MSVYGQRARDLVSWYDLSLEQKIAGGGSSLVCQDEELWKKVEMFLREGDAQETHCLGLDPLEVMEESLKATAAASGHERRRARGGLEALAKAFEVLEQAALNLHLGPWRDEYKVVKMHSGTFTHHIKPVLSVPQIGKLFGLLGYRHCSVPHEQLRLLPPAAAATANLLHLSCSFFLARCECRLLLSALGRRGGEAQWELNLVGERQRGHSLQVALEHTNKLLEVHHQSKEDVSELAGGDLDLYTDKQVNGGYKDKSVDKDESPKSFTWQSHSSSTPTAVLTHNSGTASSPCSPTSLSQEPGRGSTSKYQPNKMSPRGSSGAGSFSARSKQGRHSCEESPKLAFDNADSESGILNVQAMRICMSEPSLPSEAKHVCSCMQSHTLPLRRCVECDSLHDVTCASLQNCLSKGHSVPPQDEIAGDADKSRATPSRSASGVGALPTLTTASSLLCDGRDSASHVPITYHDCCDLADPDPRALCSDCWVFHSAGCSGVEFCRMYHLIQPLEGCSICKGPCGRKPLVLCRYCGAEYCSGCWYRHPVVCTCGQTFDQSSSV